MNTDNWQYYYKLTEYGRPVESNLVYTPLISPDNNLMCMHFCIDKKYRTNTPESLTNDTVSWLFQREVKFLQELKDSSFTPTVYDIDFNKQKIFIEFTGETLSQIVNDSTRDLNTEIPNWKDQVLAIINELTNLGYYKLSLYPHSFFINKDKKIKTIDYYSIVPHSERYIKRDIIEGIIGAGGKYRFDQATDNGILDFKKIYEITITQHLRNFWKDAEFLNQIANTKEI